MIDLSEKKTLPYYLKHLAPPVISGLMMSFSFPKLNLHLLAWISLVPLLYYLHDRDNKSAFLSGFLCGLTFFFTTIYWIYHSINHYGPLPLIPSLALVMLLSCYLSIYIGLFAYLYTLQMKKTSLPSMLVAPLFWTSLEYLRTHILTGFPWALLGYSQFENILIIQVSDITGVYGISFLIVAVNGAITDALLIKRRKSEQPLLQLYPTYLCFAGLVISIIFTVTYGYVSLTKEINHKTVKVALIQGNIEQDKKWDRTFVRYVMNTYKNMTEQVLDEKPDLIIWPETALPFYYGKDVLLTEELNNFARDIETYLLTGTMMIKDKKEKTADMKPIYTNSAILFDKNGKLSYIYDKIHLVPFGEYVPLRKVLFFVEKLTYGIGDYTPGDTFLKAVSTFGSFSTVICYEIIFPDLVRKFFKKENNLLVNITNDAWFGMTSGPYQHFSMAVFRAIEIRKPVARCANTGISGFIDEKGRILKTTKLFERVSLVKDVGINSSITFYAKYGDMFTYLVIIVSIILLIRKRQFGG
ncbi:MAG: apolipoprotein N-acyltransferase [Thermodesulfovibrionales bacterium]|nr:apolipoprotein N-acyltransferase [Thermodesulfovibrionales bacterium]